MEFEKRIEELKGEMVKFRGRIERFEKKREKIKKVFENLEVRELNLKIREVEVEIFKFKEELSRVESKFESFDLRINEEFFLRKVDFEEEIEGFVNKINVLNVYIEENKNVIIEFEKEFEELKMVEENVKDEFKEFCEGRE